MKYGYIALIILGFILVMFAYRLWQSRKSTFPMVECPRCTGKVNFLTTGNICQECAFKEMAERRANTTRSDVG